MTADSLAERADRPAGKLIGGNPAFLVLFVGVAVVSIPIAVVAVGRPVSPAIGAPFVGAVGPGGGELGVAYWTALALVGSSMVVRLRNSALWGWWLPFVVAGAVLGGPPAAAVVGFVGTFELRELRDLRPWQIIFNHLTSMTSAVAAAFAASWVLGAFTTASQAPAGRLLLVTATATFAYLFLSTAYVYVMLTRLQRRSLGAIARDQLAAVVLFGLVAASIAWVLCEMYAAVAWWGPLVVLGPVLASWLAMDRDRVHWQADHDPLTQLANRALFERSLAAAERRARRDGRPSLIVCLDLDGFKTINDRNGHAAGDRVLEAVATRLTAAARPGDLVARLGGDEFAVLIADVADAALGDDVAARLRDAVGRPMTDQPDAMVVRASVGVAFLTRETPSSREAMDRADRALYRDKGGGPDADGQAPAAGDTGRGRAVRSGLPERVDPSMVPAEHRGESQRKFV